MPVYVTMVSKRVIRMMMFAKILMNVKMMLICARLNSQDRNTNFYENIPRIFFKICEFKISEFFVSRRLFLKVIIVSTKWELTHVTVMRDTKFQKRAETLLAKVIFNCNFFIPKTSHNYNLK